MFATRRIRKWTRIIEYAGQRITLEETLARYDDDSLDHHHTFAFELDDDTFIDAGRHGNDSRFINHSCDPNCEAFLVVGDRIYIFAIRNIQPGVELAYDYNLTREGPPRAFWKRLYACRCGAKKCRGTLLELPRKRGKKPAKRRRRRSS